MEPDRGNMGGVPKLQCSFLQETEKCSGLFEQERYRDGAPMRWLPKGSVFCHALILRDVKVMLIFKASFISNSYLKAKQ